MSGVRVGTIIALTLGVLGVMAHPAWSLTAADQAFLQKKIIARWNITGKQQIEAAYARGVDVLEDHPNPANGYFTVLVSSDELEALRKDGYSIDVVEPDWYASFAQKSTMPMGGYLTWDEVAGWTDSSKLDSFHTAFPSVTTAKFSIGNSYEGRPMWAMKISDNPDIDEDEPEILITAIHHAREVITPLIILQTMRELLFNYGVDSHITELVNEREIWFVPFVNPDGYVYNQTIAPGGGGMWRKNRQDINSPSYGVDPNRNYADHWGFDDFGSSPSPSSDTYRGTGPFSEDENQNIRDLCLERNFVIAVNFHSYSNLFLWAPGYADFYTADEPLFQAIGDTVTHFNNYSAQPGWMLYNTNGDSDDWLYFDRGILAFTPEVGSQSDGFWPDPSRIPTLVNENVPGNLILIDLADQPGRIYPPAVPNWTSPDTVNASDFELSWYDNGGLNAATSYELKELEGRSVITDFTDGDENWDSDGFSVSVTRAYSGTESFWGGTGNNRRARLVTRQYYTPVANDTLRARVWYATETNWDYAYVEVSSDFGQSWATLPGNITTNTNPNGKNRGNGITGSSAGGAFVLGKFSLNAYVGDPILFRLSYETDGAVLGEGVYFDDISPIVTFTSEQVLELELTDTTYDITGKLPGTYFYSLRAKDAQSQTGGATPPHVVVVDYINCDCSCHADPVCEGNVDVLDVVETVNVAFRGTPATVDGLCPHGSGGRTDVDCSGASDVIDVVRVVGVAFRGESPAANFCDPCAP